MVVISLPIMRRWGNLHVPCEAPSAYRRRNAWTFPFFPRPVQHEVNDKSRFLGRPQLLTYC